MITLHAIEADVNPHLLLTCVIVAVAHSVAVGGTVFVTQRRRFPGDWGLQRMQNEEGSRYGLNRHQKRIMMCSDMQCAFVMMDAGACCITAVKR